jgi:hypothetical protein
MVKLYMKIVMILHYERFCYSIKGRNDSFGRLSLKYEIVGSMKYLSNHLVE